MDLRRIGMLLAAVGLLVTAGCVSRPAFPEASLTGTVVEVKIGSLVPLEVIAKQGDEVRWTNTTSSAVDISFVKSLDVAISCQRGFVSTGWGYLFGGSKIDHLLVATIYSHDYASLCFSTSGRYAYTLRIDKAGSAKGGTRLDGVVVIK